MLEILQQVSLPGLPYSFPFGNLDSDPFIPRFISFEGGKVVPVGRQAILDPDDTASTAFFTTQTVSEKHAELFFRQGAFYVR